MHIHTCIIIGAISLFIIMIYIMVIYNRRIKRLAEYFIYSNIADCIPSGVFIWDDSGKLVYCNIYGASLLGGAPADLKNTSIFNLPLEAPEKRLMLIRSVIGNLRTNITNNCHFLSSSHKSYKVISTPIIDKPNRYRYVMELVYDISQYENIETELVQSKNLVQEFSHAKFSFMAKMIHDMRTGLTAILGFSELLSNLTFGSLNERQVKYVHHIINGSNEILRVMNDIQDINGVIGGDPTPAIDEFDLFELIKNTLTTIEPLIVKNDIAVNININPEMRIVTADASIIGQILLQLLTSIVKHSQDGGSINLVALCAKDRLNITIDSIQGLQDESGLSYVKKLVQIHNGEFSIENDGESGNIAIRIPTIWKGSVNRSTASPITQIEDDLIALDLEDQEDAIRARAIQLDVPYLNVENEEPDAFMLALVPYETALKLHVLPLTISVSHIDNTGSLRLAMENPLDIEAIDCIQRLTKQRVEPVLASPEALSKAIKKAYMAWQDDAQYDILTNASDDDPVDVRNSQDDTEEFDTSTILMQSDQAPIIKFVNTLFSDAMRHQASDIHIEPRKNNFQVLYRIDGELIMMRTVPRQYQAAIISRIKIMAEMDIAERRLPLDGHITLRIDNNLVDVRISTLPVQHGERVAIRLLDRSKGRISLDQLGMLPENIVIFKDLIKRPNGLILVTGPTGSGKTTTLYAGLNYLKNQHTTHGDKRNIVTCEDPVEYEIDGISQSSVNEKAGLTFARQLRAILRQDPDIVLVGEIRDQETAEIALRASLTGNLVLSTLHSNEASGAVGRLLEMGLPAYLIASTLTGVVAQRLVRRLCPSCRKKDVPAPEELKLIHKMGLSIDTIYRPAGCAECNYQGLKGRVPIHEILVPNENMRKAIIELTNAHEIHNIAIQEGMKPMINDAVEKVQMGLTTVEEILYYTSFNDSEIRNDLKAA